MVLIASDCIFLFKILFSLSATSSASKSSGWCDVGAGGGVSGASLRLVV